MTDFKKITDLLPIGVTKLTVYKTPEKDIEGNRIQGTHKNGETKFGKWYMYSTKIGQEWVSIFGRDKDKAILDCGKVFAIVKNFKRRDGTITKVVDFAKDEEALKTSIDLESILNNSETFDNIV